MKTWPPDSHPKPRAVHPLREWVGRFLLVLVTLIICGGVLELAVITHHLATEGDNPYGADEMQETRAELIEQGGEEGLEHDRPVLALHPYIGYVASADLIRPYYGVPNTRYGFYSEVEAVYEPADTNEFVVVVLGGSVAAQLCATAGDELREHLEQLPYVNGRKVVINAMCQGGYKQPQQLLAFTYFHTLGMHADLVINIDGVNELLFFQSNLLELGVDPSFPWNWASLSPTPNRDAGVMEAQLEIIRERRNRERFAEALLESGWYRSAAVRLGAHRLNRGSERRERRAEHRLVQRLEVLGVQGDLAYAQRGPVFVEADDLDGALAESADLWCRASIALNDLLRANGIPYLHGLQPNQYFATSRPLTDWEVEHAYHTDSDFYEPLSRGYPHLLDCADDLLAHGVPFVNLGEPMADIEETIYQDNFSHFNQFGNEQLARIVAEAVGDMLARRVE